MPNEVITPMVPRPNFASRLLNKAIQERKTSEIKNTFSAQPDNKYQLVLTDSNEPTAHVEK